HEYTGSLWNLKATKRFSLLSSKSLNNLQSDPAELVALQKAARRAQRVVPGPAGASTIISPSGNDAGPLVSFDHAATMFIESNRNSIVEPMSSARNSRLLHYSDTSSLQGLMGFASEFPQPPSAPWLKKDEYEFPASATAPGGLAPPFPATPSAAESRMGGANGGADQRASWAMRSNRKTWTTDDLLTHPGASSDPAPDRRVSTHLENRRQAVIVEKPRFVRKVASMQGRSKDLPPPSSTDKSSQRPIQKIRRSREGKQRSWLASFSRSSHKQGSSSMDYSMTTSKMKSLKGSPSARRLLGHPIRPSLQDVSSSLHRSKTTKDRTQRSSQNQRSRNRDSNEASKMDGGGGGRDDGIDSASHDKKRNSHLKDRERRTRRAAAKSHGNL
ncbi:hypothetical protein BKA70DRAFT_1259437, partial [Coprinopsis sp. MPI-PUGE-AT-0042]